MSVCYPELVEAANNDITFHSGHQLTRILLTHLIQWTQMACGLAKWYLLGIRGLIYLNILRYVVNFKTLNCLHFCVQHKFPAFEVKL